MTERLKPVSVDRASAKAELQIARHAFDGFDNQAFAIMSEDQRSKLIDSRILNSRTKARTDATIRLIRAGVAAFITLSGIFGFKAIKESLKPPVVPPAVAQPLPRARSENSAMLPPKSDRGLKKHSRGP